MEDPVTPSTPGEYAAPGLAVDATHRVVGCFYGMLSALQLPLTQFVASRRAKTPKLTSEIESQHSNLARMGVGMQLLFVRDHWATHFSTILPNTALVDVRLLLQVLQQIQFSAAISVKIYHSGIVAIERLLGVVGASANAVQQAQALKTMMRVYSFDQKLVGSPVSAPPSLDGLSSGNRRLGLTQQAKQIMDTNDQAAATGDAVDTTTYDEAITLLDTALELASTPNQRCRILAMRSECQTQCGRDTLACEDGQAALATQIELTKWTAMKLVGVFKTVGRWTDVVTTCDLALRTEPRDEELLREKTAALVMVNSVDLRGSSQDQTPAEPSAAETPEDAVDADVGSDDLTSDDYKKLDKLVTSLFEVSDQPTSPDLAISGPQRSEKIHAIRGDTSPLPLLIEPEATSENEKMDSAGSYFELVAHNASTMNKKKARTTPKRDSKELRTAKLCADLKEYEEAVFWLDKEIQRTRKKPQTHASLYVMRAQCQFELNEFKSVLADAQKALAIDSTVVEAYPLASEALLKLNRVSEAHSTCSAGRKLDRSNERLKELEKEICRRSLAAHVNRVAAMQTPTPTPSVASSRKDEDTFSTDETAVDWPPWKTAIQIGVGFVQKGNLSAAENAFAEALALLADEDDATDSKVKILGHRARCRLSMKQYQLAIDDARHGLQVNPDWVEGHRLVCKGFMGQERWRDALKECEIVLRAVPQDTHFNTFHAKIKAKITGVTGAFTAAPKPAVVTAPNYAPWYPKMQACIHAGLLNVENKRYVDGDACFTNALSVLKKVKGSTPDIALKQSRIKVFGHRARCRLAMENWLGAAEDARAGIQFQADWIEGYRLLCHALKGANQWQKALDACQHVLLHVPKDVAFTTLKTELEVKRAEDLTALGQESDVVSVASHESSAKHESVPERTEVEDSVEDESMAESSEGEDSEEGESVSGSHEDDDSAENESVSESSEDEDGESSRYDIEPELADTRGV